MGPIWGRQDPGGPHLGPMNFAIWVFIVSFRAINVLNRQWNLIIEYYNSADRAKGQPAMINTKTLFNSVCSSDTHGGIVKSDSKFIRKAQ